MFMRPRVKPIPIEKINKETDAERRKHELILEQISKRSKKEILDLCDDVLKMGRHA